MRTFIISLFTVLVLTSCAPQSQFNLNNSMPLKEVSDLETRYASVEKLIRKMQNDRGTFSESEWRSLLNVDATIDMLIARINNIMKFQTTTVSMQEIEFLWGLSTSGYTEAREVIYAHWSSFTPSTQLTLTNFDVKAETMSTFITELMKNPTDDTMTQALTVITGIINIAVKMLGMTI